MTTSTKTSPFPIDVLGTHQGIPPLRHPETANPYLARQAVHESNARSYPRRIPIAIHKAKGMFVHDTEGRVYIDCLAGAGALALGHNHPVVVEAIQREMAADCPMQTLDLTTPVKDRFIQSLLTSLPSNFAANARIQFCGPSGADAVEAAIKLVKTATGRRSVLSFHGGYHGMTHGALSLTGHLDPKEAIAGLMADVHFLPFPYDYRCPFGIGGERGHQIASAYVENLLKDPNSGVLPPAAMILECVQGEGGVIPAPGAWFREIRRITADRGIPLIVDEVQTGLGRTGTLYAFEQAGIIPDVVILSKAIGGGLPLSVVVYDASLDRWSPGAHAGTFRGNQLAMAAGAATLEYIVDHRLADHAHRRGEQLMEAIRLMQKEFPCLGDVRGQGLMIGVEIVNADSQADACGSYPANPDLAQRIQRASLHRGLILELGGRNGCVVRFLPPLVVTDVQIDEISTIFHDAVKAAQHGGEAE
ncbi:MAG: diaminobutyrate--2-oxoglutarate transaminase [Nitrospirales bacterium]|nr:MAG: diaminobutyrate--2-oxoglutarate transaminase [Nitrospirales bacterium]